MTISKKEAKYFEQVLRKRFRDGELTKEQIEKLKSHGFKFDLLKKPVICIETNEIFNSATEAAIKLNCHKSSISACCRNKKQTIVHGYHWAYVDDTKRITELAEFKGKDPVPNSKPVICIETGEIFKSIKLASRNIALSASSLRQCVASDNSKRTSGGYHWAYVDDTKRIAELAEFKGKESTFRTNKIICVETGEIFKNITDATTSCSTKKGAIGSIAKCCKSKKIRTAYGYHWAYADDTERITELAEFKGKKPAPTIHPILCIETGRTFQNAHEAAKIMNLPRPNDIRTCCHGIQNTAYNYHWAYADDETRIKELSKFKGQEPIPTRNRSIICIETGQTYPSPLSAAQHIGKPNRKQNISDCCRGVCKTAHGYHWAYADNTERIAELAEFKNQEAKPKNRSIICIETSKIFQNGNRAAEHMKLPNGKLIKKCCDKKQKTAYGYHWAYADDTERIEELTEFANKKKED